MSAARSTHTSETENKGNYCKQQDRSSADEESLMRQGRCALLICRLGLLGLHFFRLGADLFRSVRGVEMLGVREFSMDLSFSNIDEFGQCWRSDVLGYSRFLPCLLRFRVETIARTCIIVGADECSEGTSFRKLDLIELQYVSNVWRGCSFNRFDLRREE